MMNCPTQNELFALLSERLSETERASVEDPVVLKAMLAAFEGDPNGRDAVLRAGEKLGGGQTTPLLAAVLANRPKNVRTLLEAFGNDTVKRRAYVSLKGMGDHDYNKTSLDLARERNQDEIVALLEAAVKE
jgi:hypothetical protein